MKRITIILLLLLSFVAFGQQAPVNGWVFNPAGYFGKSLDTEKTGSKIKDFTQSFSVFGEPFIQNNIWYNEGIFYKNFDKEETIFDELSIESQLLFSINAKYAKVNLGFGNSAGKTCYLDGIMIPLSGESKKIVWTLTAEEKNIMKTYNVIYLCFITATEGPSYTGNTTALKNMKKRTSSVEEILDFNFSPVAVEKEQEIPSSFKLEQNYPNPFNPTTKIQFSIPESGNYKLTIYNSIFQEIETLISGELTAGVHNVTFNASNLSSGTYFYRLTGTKTSLVKKMVLLK